MAGPVRKFYNSKQSDYNCEYENAQVKYLIFAR